MKILFVILLFVFSFITVVAQETQADTVYKSPVDTVRGDEFDIVLFDNNTWEYLDHDSVMAILHLRDSINTYSYILSKKLYTPDSLTIFSEEWDTVNIFAFGNIDYKRALDTFAIPILGDTGKFAIPITGDKISNFGWRWGRMHNGIDLKLKTGDTVVAAFDGIVRFASRNKGGYGNLVIIRHFNGLETYYAHLSSLNCTDNQKVCAGECIGLGGSTGRSNGPHLHFEMRFKDNPFDPEYLVDFETKELKTDILYLMPEKFGHVKEISNSQYHTINSGDTLWGISRRYGTSINYICSLNGITENTCLRIGQKLRVR